LYSVTILTVTLTIVTQMFSHLLQAFHSNARIVPQNEP